MLHTFKLTCVFALLFLFSCNKEECIVNTDISTLTKTMEEFGYDDAITEMRLNISEPYSIINNQTDYDEFVEGDCHPAIDFNQYQLLIGYFVSKKEVVGFEYKFYESVEPNFFKLTLTPEYSTEEYDEISTYFYQLLVPADKSIEFLSITTRKIN